MDLGIVGKRAIVCASSRGLGRACAASLAANGVDLVLNGRDAARLDAVAKEIAAETGVVVTTVPGDIAEPSVQARLLAACDAPDILVNNNGGPPSKDFRDLDRAAMIEGVIMNMITPIELISAVVDGMAERGFGRIVNITSITVMTPVPGLDLSSAARAGLTAFLAGVTPQVAAQNVTINNLLPGRFDTDRLRANLTARATQIGIDADVLAEQQRELIPVKRFGMPEELGEACAFLCGARAGYITGQNILIDGGQYPGVW